MGMDRIVKLIDSAAQFTEFRSIAFPKKSP